MSPVIQHTSSEAASDKRSGLVSVDVLVPSVVVVSGSINRTRWVCFSAFTIPCFFLVLFLYSHIRRETYKSPIISVEWFLAKARVRCMVSCTPAICASGGSRLRMSRLAFPWLSVIGSPPAYAHSASGGQHAGSPKCCSALALLLLFRAGLLMLYIRAVWCFHSFLGVLLYLVVGARITPIVEVHLSCLKP